MGHRIGSHLTAALQVANVVNSEYANRRHASTIVESSTIYLDLNEWTGHYEASCAEQALHYKLPAPECNLGEGCEGKHPWMPCPTREPL